MDLIHCDLWEPAYVISVDAYYYYVVFIDDHSCFSWFYLLKTNSTFFFFYCVHEVCANTVQSKN